MSSWRNLKLRRRLSQCELFLWPAQKTSAGADTSPSASATGTSKASFSDAQRHGERSEAAEKTERKGGFFTSAALSTPPSSVASALPPCCRAVYRPPLTPKLGSFLLSSTTASLALG
jgi:hypothetical protein